MHNCHYPNTKIEKRFQRTHKSKQLKAVQKLLDSLRLNAQPSGKAPEESNEEILSAAYDWRLLKRVESLYALLPKLMSTYETYRATAVDEMESRNLEEILQKLKQKEIAEGEGQRKREKEREAEERQRPEKANAKTKEIVNRAEQTHQAEQVELIHKVMNAATERVEALEQEANDRRLRAGESSVEAIEAPKEKVNDAKVRADESSVGMGSSSDNADVNKPSAGQSHTPTGPAETGKEDLEPSKDQIN